MACIHKTVYYKLHNCLLVSLRTYAVLRIKLSDEAIETRCIYIFSSQNTSMQIFNHTKVNFNVFRNDLCQSSYRIALTMSDYICANKLDCIGTNNKLLNVQRKKYLFDNAICIILADIFPI